MRTHRPVLSVLVALVLWPAVALGQSPELVEAFNRYQALYAEGRYAEAEVFASKALELGKHEFGADHPHVGAFLSRLAGLYYAQGRYAHSISRASYFASSSRTIPRCNSTSRAASTFPKSDCSFVESTRSVNKIVNNSRS